MSKPGTITVEIKVKYLWLVIGLLLVLLATAPIYTLYLPSSSGSGSGGGSSSGSSAGGGSSSGSQVTCPNPCTIYIRNSVFGFNVSNTQVVKAGTHVTWMNIDDTEHTSTSDTGLWDSGVIGVGHSYTVIFNQTGTFTYHCNIHPMTGTIVVVS